MGWPRLMAFPGRRLLRPHLRGFATPAPARPAAALPTPPGDFYAWATPACNVAQVVVAAGCGVAVYCMARWKQEMLEDLESVLRAEAMAQDAATQSRRAADLVDQQLAVAQQGRLKGRLLPAVAPILAQYTAGAL
eukprot:EG_transcript_28690